MSTPINVGKLTVLVGEKAAKTAAAVFDDAEQLARANAGKLASALKISTEDAQSIIDWACLVTGIDAAPAAAPAAGNAEVIEGVIQGHAPEGTTAIKTMVRVGERGKPYLGCSFCGANIQDEASMLGISTNQLNSCPQCDAEFVQEEKVYCYRCSTPMSAAGKCHNCHAKRSDDLLVKQATAYFRKEKGLEPAEAGRQARLAVQDSEWVNRTLARSQAKIWLRDYEEGRGQAQIEGPAVIVSVPGWNSSVVRHILKSLFSPQEIKEIASDHYRPVYDDFSSGMTKGEMVETLVTFVQNRSLQQDLLSRIREARPNAQI